MCTVKIDMFYIFLAISLLFLAGVLARYFIKLRFCVLCASIAITWLILLVLFKIGRFHDQVLLSLLMGQSIAGIFYLVQRRVPKALLVFTLPFFLSLTAVFYILITADFILPVFVLLTFLWILTWLIFTSRNDPGRRSLTKAIMECCEDK